MMEKDAVVVVIDYQALKGRGDEARRELAALIAEVVAREPHCLGIRLHRQADDDTRFLLYELWTDREAYTGPHMQTPHLRAFREKAPEFFAGPPTITYWRLTDDLVRR
jgi:quinol monooxygenase YgiN